MALVSITEVNAQKKNAKVKTEKKMQFSCPMKCEGDKTYKSAGKCPKCKMDLKAVTAASTASQFICPMKCEGEKMYAKNGKCPLCKMDLAKVKTVAVKEDHTGHNHN